MTTTVASAQLRQLEHPQLQEHQVWYNDRQHLLIIDSVVIDCTPSSCNGRRTFDVPIS
jgi:hypothetical protein